MEINLKNIIKELSVLYLSPKDEDLNKITNILNIFFRKVYFETKEKEATNKLKKARIDFLIVDIDIEEKSGMQFIKNIRKHNKTIPILITTKNKKLKNILQAVKLNLIDYMLKPVDTNQFISALNETAKKIVNEGKIIAHINDKIQYNYLNKKIIRDNESIKLTKNESKLLELFILNRKKIVKKDEIKSTVWKNINTNDNTLKSLFNRLSKKLGKDIIINIFGVGYLLE